MLCLFVKKDDNNTEDKNGLCTLLLIIVDIFFIVFILELIGKDDSSERIIGFFTFILYITLIICSTGMFGWYKNIENNIENNNGNDIENGNETK